MWTSTGRCVISQREPELIIILWCHPRGRSECQILLAFWSLLRSTHTTSTDLPAKPTSMQVSIWETSCALKLASVKQQPPSLHMMTRKIHRNAFGSATHPGKQRRSERICTVAADSKPGPQPYRSGTGTPVTSKYSSHPTLVLLVMEITA